MNPGAHADGGRLTKRLLVLLCGLLAAGAARAAPPDSTAAGGARAITLAEALELARQNSPQNIQADGQVRSGHARVRSAYGAFLPSLTLNAGPTRQYRPGQSSSRIENGTVVQLPSSPWSYSAGFSGSVALFTGGQRIFDVGQTRSSLKAAEANEVVQRYGVDLEVKQQFFNVLAARESEIAARAQVEQAELQLKTAMLKLRTATATKSDSLRSQIQLNNAQLALEQAGADLATANAALAHVVGVTEAVTASEPDTVPAPVAIDEAELTRLASEGPAVRQAQSQLATAKSARSSAWTNYLPSLSASYGRVGSGSGTDMWYTGGNLGYSGTLRLSAALPIFDGFNRESQMVQSDVDQDNARAALRDAQLAARENVTRYLGALRTAERRTAVQSLTVESAEEDLRVQQLRYSHGESVLLDVLTSQTQLNDARAALIRARYDQRVARAQLEALIGRDL